MLCKYSNRFGGGSDPRGSVKSGVGCACRQPRHVPVIQVDFHGDPAFSRTLIEYLDASWNSPVRVRTPGLHHLQPCPPRTRELTLSFPLNDSPSFFFSLPLSFPLNESLSFSASLSLSLSLCSTLDLFLSYSVSIFFSLPLSVFLLLACCPSISLFTLFYTYNNKYDVRIFLPPLKAERQGFINWHDTAHIATDQPQHHTHIWCYCHNSTHIWC